jgi:hypothetical protein
MNRGDEYRARDWFGCGKGRLEIFRWDTLVGQILYQATITLPSDGFLDYGKDS